MISSRAFLLLLAGLACQPVHAEPLYKWTDSAGNVNYSSSPPPAGVEAEKVQPVPQPSAEDIRQAEESLERAQALARELEDERLRQDAAEAEEARLRALESPPPPIVIETPVYVPQPVYYPPVREPRPKRPRPDDEPRRRPPLPPVFLPVPPPAP
jgi:Domain of unknown function (DUF4124)